MHAHCHPIVHPVSPTYIHNGKNSPDCVNASETVRFLTSKCSSQFLNTILWTDHSGCVRKIYLISRGLAVTLIEDDLLTALKELHEASLTMTSGKLPSASDMERYNRAIEWSKRVIALAERSE